MKQISIDGTENLIILIRIKMNESERIKIALEYSVQIEPVSNPSTSFTTDKKTHDKFKK